MIKNIKLINWRNFKNIELDLNNNLVIFLGNNAVGKTSILEAIYYISTLKSHRTNNYIDLINEDSSSSLIEVNYNNLIIKTNFNKQEKNYFINGNKVKVIDFISRIKPILFSTYDNNLIIGEREDKRKFLDLNISLIDKIYLNNLVLYKKNLSKRNEELKKENIDLTLIKILTDNLIDLSEKINNKRIIFLNKINKYLVEIADKLNIFKISLDFNISTNLAKLYKDNLNKDILLKTTTVGPHRDSFEILINDKKIKKFASQGQMRMAIIMLKLAIYEIVREENTPILLLDDVFAELDYDNQIKLVSYLDNYQTFITTTTLIEIPNELLKKALIIKLGKE